MKSLSVWLLRLLLAILLLFGSDILLWTNPLNRSLVEWVELVIGYVALAALMLDFAVRYRIRDIYDALTLSGIFALSAGILLYPQTALADFPRTLMSRVMGGYMVFGAEMFGLWLVLTGGHIIRYKRLMLGYSVWLGFYWGIWVRWSPLLTDVSEGEVSLQMMFTLAGVIGIITLIFFVVATRRAATLQPLDLRLTVLEWGLAAVVLLSLFILRLTQRDVILEALPAFVLLAILCWAILWFRRADSGKTLLDAHFPPVPLGWGWITAAVILFAGAAALAYSLPLTTVLGYNQLSVMEFLFAGVGLLWLPTVAAVLSIRAFDRQSQILES